MIKKKRIPWNKGLRGVQNHTEETKKKISKNNGRGFLGKKHTKETKRKMSENNWSKRNAGIKSPQWKGNNVGYTGLHNWVRKCLGEPTKCEHCDKDGLTGKQIGWANIDHKYRRNLSDWLRLCVKCHRKWDKQLNL